MAGTALRGRVVDIPKIFTKECRKLLRFEIVKLATENGSFFRPIVNLIKKGNIPNILGSSESSVSRGNCFSLNRASLYFLLWF